MQITVSILTRVFKVYTILGKTFGTWFSPIITGIGNIFFKILIFLGSIFDYLFLFSKLRNTKIKQPILIVGNPRSGTTFLHHYLTSHGLGTGSQLWQILFPSIILQKLIKPFLPFLEKISPTIKQRTKLKLQK